MKTSEKSEKSTEPLPETGYGLWKIFVTYLFINSYELYSKPPQGACRQGGPEKSKKKSPDNRQPPHLQEVPQRIMPVGGMVEKGVFPRLKEKAPEGLHPQHR
jgi:hypothetical protein